MRYAIAVRTGRNANGFSRDGGQVVHAIALEEEETRLHDGSARKALCGARPQGISYWGEPAQSKEPTCPRCLKKLVVNQGAKP